MGGQNRLFLAFRPGQWSCSRLHGMHLLRHNPVIIRQGKSERLKTVFPPSFYMTEASTRYEQNMAAGIPLVCHRSGQRVLSYRTAWENACKKAGVIMRPYDIRHIAATEMLARGADLAAVAAQLGHSSVAATGSTYAHVAIGSQARAAALIPSLDIFLAQKKKGDTNEHEKRGYMPRNPLNLLGAQSGD